MTSFFSLGNFLSRRNKYADGAAKRQNRSRLLRLEALENRELLDAAGYHGAASDSVLVSTIVTTVADVVADDGHISLREAVTNAANAGKTITFAPEVVGGVTKLKDTLEISQSITIDAWTIQTQEGASTNLGDVLAASKGITVDGVNIVFKPESGTDNSGEQPIVSITGANSNVKIIGLTITNSNKTLASSSFTSDTYDGVGLHVKNATVDLRNSAVRGLSYNKGGAVVAEGSANLTATNVLIVDNIGLSGTYASAVDLVGAPEATFFNCTIVNNKDGSGEDCSYGISTKKATECLDVGIFNTILAGNTTNSVEEDWDDGGDDQSEINFTPIKITKQIDGATYTFWKSYHRAFVGGSIIGNLKYDRLQFNDYHGREFDVYFCQYANGSWSSGDYEYYAPEIWNVSKYYNGINGTFYRSGTVADLNGLFKNYQNGDYTLMPVDTNVAHDNGVKELVTVNNSISLSLPHNSNYASDSFVRTAGYYDGTYNSNENNAFDLAGNSRVNSDNNVDIGAYSKDSCVVPNILVTIAEDVVDHSDDFNEDGTPNNISLREAYFYVNRYFKAEHLFKDGPNNTQVFDTNYINNPANWIEVDDFDNPFR